MMPDRTRSLLNEGEKEPRGANLVIALTAGSYSSQGFELALNLHYMMQLVFPGTVTYHYVFKQVGF
jgi:hypothetical protein